METVIYNKIIINFMQSQHCTQKMKFFIKYLFSKCDEIGRFYRTKSAISADSADLVPFTEEILNE